MTGLLLLALLAQDGGLRQAIAAREAQRWDDSDRLLRQSVRANPDNGEAWWYLGLNAYDRELSTPCAEAFGQVYRLDPRNAGAAAFLGICEFQLGKYETSFSHLVMAQRAGLEPGSQLRRAAHHHYLQLLNKLGQFEAGGELLAATARETPDLPLLTAICGLNALRIAKIPKEIAPVEEEAVNLAGRAVSLAWQRKLTAAKPYAATLREKYPGMRNVNYVLGYLAVLEQSPEALTYFRRELTVSPGQKQALLQLANEHLRRGEAAEALPYAVEAVRGAPGDFAAQLVHGRVLLELDRPAEAVKALEVAARLAPEFPETHFTLARAYSAVGRKAEAAKHREIFTRLKKEKP